MRGERNWRFPCDGAKMPFVRIGKEGERRGRDGIGKGKGKGIERDPYSTEKCRFMGKEVRERSRAIFFTPRHLSVWCDFHTVISKYQKIYTHEYIVQIESQTDRRPFKGGGSNERGRFVA